MNPSISLLTIFILIFIPNCQSQNIIFQPALLPVNEIINQRNYFVSLAVIEPLEYPPVLDRSSVFLADQQRQLGSAIDVLLQFNLKMCATCESLKYFAIKAGNNNATTLSYMKVGSTCLGSLNFAPPTGPSGRPGNDQLFVATQLQDETWLLQPKNCLGAYVKATSSSTVAVASGLSSSARFWFLYHMNHVHMKSGVYTTSYWGGVSPLNIGPGASPYIVEFWPERPWP